MADALSSVWNAFSLESWEQGAGTRTQELQRSLLHVSIRGSQQMFTLCPQRASLAHYPACLQQHVCISQEIKKMLL